MHAAQDAWAAQLATRGEVYDALRDDAVRAGCGGRWRGTRPRGRPSPPRHGRRWGHGPGSPPPWRAV
ncbi:protein of unknown function [Streptomyces murinus]